MIVALLAFVALVFPPAPVRGDFDHDGRPDVAEVRPRPDGGYRLVVVRAGGQVEPVDTLGGVVEDYYVRVHKPGTLRTACAKGYGSDREPCPIKSVRLVGDTLSFGVTEKAMAVALWDGRRFNVVWISD